MTEILDITPPQAHCLGDEVRPSSVVMVGETLVGAYRCRECGEVWQVPWSIEAPKTARAEWTSDRGPGRPPGPHIVDVDGLTKQQRRVLDTIINSVEDRGYPPSITEIMAAVGYGSSSSVLHQLRVLEAKGWIRRLPGQRALEILRLPGPVIRDDALYDAITTDREPVRKPRLEALLNRAEEEHADTLDSINLRRCDECGEVRGAHKVVCSRVNDPAPTLNAAEEAYWAAERPRSHHHD